METFIVAILSIILILDAFFSFAIVFFQRKNPKSAWAWLLLINFMPVVGFLFYVLFGMDMHKQKIFQMKGVEDRLGNAIRQQENKIRKREIEKETSDVDGFTDLVLFNLATNGSVFTDDNDVEIITDGEDKFARMMEDIKQAHSFIHIQYYIIKKDVLFENILKLLRQKVKEGVEVRILYDGMGCRTVKKSFWEELRKEGFEVAEFFPATFGRFNLRINYRNHRKIVVVDNRVGYVGGFNVGKEYISLDPKFGYWRDTHMRIVGQAVSGLELRFILDWNYASRKNLFAESKYMEGFDYGYKDNCGIQVVTSGPDSNMQNIRNNYVRLIHKATKSIYIQTPYFIPDEAMYNALLIALYSGVEVNIMIPCKPDHMFVYWATYSYIGELVMAGAKCYTYERGFLHAKGIIIDDKVFCYGTANMDIRSFALNFEVNVVVYNERKALEMRKLFENDLQYCKQITRDVYTSRSLLIRFKEQISRLLSPLL